MRRWGLQSHGLWPPSVLPALTWAKQPACLYRGPRAPVPFCRRDSLTFPRSRSLPTGISGWSSRFRASATAASSPPHPHREL